MQNDLTQESLDNKKTLDFLIELTEMLSKSNAIIGRNEYLFAVDVTKSPKLFSDDGKEVARFFNRTRLFISHEIAFGFTIFKAEFKGVFYNKNSLKYKILFQKIFSQL